MDTRILPPLFVGTGGVSRTQDAPSQTPEQQNRSQYKAPNKAQDNYIPSPELLNNLINQAVEAKSKGVYWDRGSIINLVL